MNGIDYSQIGSAMLGTSLAMRFLDINLEIAKKDPKLSQILKFTWLWVFIFLFGAELLKLKFITEHIYNIVGLVAIYIVYQYRQEPVARMLGTAIIPSVIAVFLRDITKFIFPVFYKENDDIIGLIFSFTVFWLLGFAFYTQRQVKQQRIEREQAEQERKIMEAKKQELEYQVAERTAELRKQKESLEIALEELKITQNQLIHAEKMASLGELTAGIAHEIQNPLNFVNNFSEVSVELCQELKEELDRENFDKEYIVEILGDISKNQQKIAHHGQRAASIVRGMLQHSRASTGQKELTDINALADEYLRLSYHGLRAKDKTFNADFKTNLDVDLPKIELIPQDFGRVLLNIINNAFYAVQQKSKLGIEGYKPTVTISTLKLEEEILIKISDNGTGMPESVKAKVFQPFFTTKPTGQGTGLGLSLSYDIITKGHGGSLEVESNEGEGTMFLIKLPIK